jgi:hypothetical protein
MTEIKDSDVYWEMKSGKDSCPDNPSTEMIFEEELALARLLAEGVVHMNSHWFEESWPDEAKKTVYLGVICNDIFAWACADSEPLEYAEIQSLYDAWIADKTWGSSKWCAIKRNQKPQMPVIEAMKRDGAWDETMESLGDNWQEAEVQAMVAELARAEK